MALFIGYYNSEELEVIIDINLLGSGYFKMGIFHEPYVTDIKEIDVLTFGMLLIEIQFRFIRELKA